jgi:ribosome-binding factor A
MIGESIEKEKSSIDNKVLKKFSGMVRSKLSKTMQIRRVPVIQFRFDESIEYSDNIENLLRNL